MLKHFSKLAGVVALLVMSGIFCISVSAVEPIDFMKDGDSTIQIILKTLTDTKPVEGASLTLYQLQKLDQQNGFVWNPEYMDCDVLLDGLSSSELAQAAKGIVKYIEEQHIAGIQQQDTDENGMTIFTGLELGMYLVVWDHGPTDIEPMSPVLMSVPIEDPSGWIYDLEVEPKIDVKKEEPPEEPSGEPSSEPFTPEEPPSESIPPEETPPKKDSTPEKESSEEPSSEKITTEEITKPSEESSESEMTSTKEPIPEESGKLPQTGPRRWTIFLFAGVGILLFASGAYTRVSKAGKSLMLSNALMGIGMAALFAAIGITGFAYKQEQEAAKQADYILAEYEKRYFDEAYEKVSVNGTIGIEIEGELYGGILSIPKLGSVLPVDMELSKEQLRNTPCRYKGSVQEDSMIIAAHNYARHFGNLSLLEAGDEVYFVDAQGKQHEYLVSESEILDAYDVQEMEEGDWDLTLFTCTYGGQSRVTVRCKRQ